MKKYLVILLALFSIFGAYLSFPSYTLYDSKRIFQLLLFSVFGILFIIQAVISSRSTRKVDFYERLFSDTHLKVVLIILMFSIVISILMSNFPEKAVVDVLFHLLLIILSFMLAPKILKEHYNLGRIIYAAAILYVGIYLIIFLGNYISSFFNPMPVVWPNGTNFFIDFGNFIVEPKEILYFVNKRFFNHTQTWTFPLLIGAFVFSHRSKNYNFIAPILLVLISLWWMLLYQSGGRGTTLSIYVAGFFLWIYTKKDFKPFVKPLFITAIAGWIFKYFLFDLPFPSTAESIFRTQHSRFYRIEGAIEVWWENIWFGIGPGHYGEIGPTQFVGHPHNYYLQILSEWGVISFICLTIIFISALKFVLIKYKSTTPLSKNRINFIVMSWSITAAFCNAFFSGIMHTPISQIWFVLILAWFIGYFTRDKNIKINEKKTTIFYLCSLSVILFIIYPEILTLNELYEAYFEQYPGQSLRPRFWGQGLFPLD